MDLPMNEMPVQYTVDELLPHKGRMVLLDEILNWDANSLTASVCVGSNGLFVDKQNSVPAWVGIEYMAQTIAAWAGTKALQIGNPVRPGYLLGTRKYVARTESFKCLEELVVFVEQKYHNNEMSAFDCLIKANDGGVIATASLSVYQPES